MPFRKKGTNRIFLRTEALLSAGSGSKLLRVPRSPSKEHINPVNPVRQEKSSKPKDNAKKIKGKRGKVKVFLRRQKNQLIADSSKLIGKNLKKERSAFSACEGQGRSTIKRQGRSGEEVRSSK